MHRRTQPFKALIGLCLAAGLLSGAAQAANHACPDLKTAVQVAACPTEAELKYTYMGFCGDNARLYGRDVLTCSTFENYREAKNIAMWESADGKFSGYLSCNVPAEQIHASKPLRMSSDSKNGLTRLVCDYENDHRMVYRSKQTCKVVVADCSTGDCTAECE